MTRSLALLAALALVSCQDAAPDAAGGDAPIRIDGTFAEVDDGADDPAFVAFRDSLRAIVARRDTAALLAAVAPGARLSFGDDTGGPEGFRQMWFSGTVPDGAPVWGVLGQALRRGSVEADGAYTVPYVFGAWPFDTADAMTHVAVVGQGVEARESPSDTSRVAALVSHAILATGGLRAGGFQQVRLPDGGAAYVPDSLAVSPLGWRASIWDDGDGMRLQTFLSGD